MKKTLRIQVFGKVQGVGYRYYTRKRAKELNLSGFVRNKADGSVLIDAKGEEQEIKKLIEWCSMGPDLAKVDKVTVNEIPEIGNHEFYIA